MAAAPQPADALDATIVIVNYNGRGILAPCLEGCAGQAGCTVETIVIDNASADGSWDEAVGVDGVQLVRNAENVGFGRACNQGAALARGRHVAFLNFDSVPEPDWCVRLVAVADNDPTAGAVQGLILIDPDGDVMTAGNRVHYLGFSWAPIGLPPREQVPHEITTGCGASLLVPRARFEEVGGFWDALFLYHEDLDLCWRLRMRGYRIVCEPRAVTHHRYEFSRNPTKHLQMERGRWLTMAANLEAGTLLRLAPALAATELGLLAVSARDGWLRQKLGATRSALAAVPAVRRQRRAVQGARMTPDREVLRHFETRLGDEFGVAAARATAPILALYARVVGVPARSGPAVASGSLHTEVTDGQY
jgi:GT2 family glycosyltransferase